MQPDDLTLIARWRDGDDAAGRALFERYFDSIYRFFTTKLDDEADELTQSTFLACVRAKDQFRGASSFRTYLFTIARHELHQRLRRHKRHDARLDFDASSVAEIVTTPGTKLVRHEEHGQLIEALRALPEAQQSLLELHYWEELSISELAAIFGSPEPTIRTRLHRARLALRKAMEGAAPARALETLESMDDWVRGTPPSTKSRGG